MKSYYFSPSQLQEIGQLGYPKSKISEKEAFSEDRAEHFRANMFQMFNTNPSLAVASFLMWVGDDEILDEFKETLAKIKASQEAKI